VRVLVVGQESSGTRLLARLLTPAVAEVVHRSVPYGEQWWDDPGDVAAAVVIVRSWAAVAPSQQARGHMAVWEPMTTQEKLQTSFIHLLLGIIDLGVPYTVVTYEDLVRDVRQALMGVCAFLGVPTPEVMEPVRDENQKWLP
jgi:hypothetical protein